jgi:hypothetical protein
LRFWYRKSGDPFWEIQHGKTLETLGDLIATLEPAGVSGPDQVPAGYGGYILFTSAGKWKVSAFQGDQVLASVVLVVTEA